MLRGEAAVSFIKLGVSAATAGIAATPVLDAISKSVDLPVWGVPVSVVGAAAFGAGLSLFFGDLPDTRRMLYGQTLAATAFGVATAVLVADGMGWAWAQKHIPMFALMCAAMIRWWLPGIIERGKAIVKDFKLPSFKKGADK